MSEKSIENKIEKSKAFLIGIALQNEDYDTKMSSLDELERLADTAGIETVDKFIQTRKGIDRSTYVGKGFLEDIAIKMDMLKVDFVIFDDELSPTQSRNILKTHEVEAIDRTEIILDIFHKHARTKEAKLQVGLAELKYQLPRLKKLWSHLDRERGSSGSGKGTSRGMGEKQLNIDKRLIKSEIKKINKQLEKISLQKDTQKSQRMKMKKVCVVGYTNAGKSTLFNQMTDAGVLVEDKLFATLESTTRAYEIKKGNKIVLSDTVGFISNLPHNLVASFRATLKNVSDADLLLHVVDISDEFCEKNMADVNKVLKEIDSQDIKQLIVFNKIDNLPAHRERVSIFKDKFENSISISALNNENLDLLVDKLDDYLNFSKEYEFLLPHDKQKEIAWFHSNSDVVSIDYEDEFVRIKAVLSSDNFEVVKSFVVEM